MKYGISVIIPCYNCEDTINDCIESVINQSIGFENIELILVDDKSKDNTRNIIERFSKKYDNITPIFLEKNSGYPGKPRNIGIRQAEADYIMFMDNDDKYDFEICEKLYKEIKEEEADLATCNFINIDSYSQNYCEIEYKNGRKLEDKIIIENEDVNYFKTGTIWCNIFKKSIIIDNNITFPENKLYEDVWFMINYLTKSKKVVYLNNYYGYLRSVNSRSTTHSMSIEQFNGMWDTIEESMNLFPKDYDLSYWYKSNILWTYIHLIKNNLISKKETYKFLKRISSIENKMDFNEKILLPFDIVNKFVMKGNYKIAMSLLNIYIYV